MYDLIVLGGGAAGVFAAIWAKKSSPEARVCLFEKTAQLLSKVRISGGGRCNVTHACFDPLTLVKNYPRGSKELIGPFHRFQPRDMMEWLEERGVALKVEPDGRVFPCSDSSETIIRALLDEAKSVGVEICLQKRIDPIYKLNDHFELQEGERVHQTKALILATGSSPKGFEWATRLGHAIVKPIPSLFTFNVPHFALSEMSGIALEDVMLSLSKGAIVERGPLLITHFGFSGPCAIKLSAWAAAYCHEHHYEHELIVNWLPKMSPEEIFEALKSHPHSQPPSFGFPKRLWNHFSQELKGQSHKELRRFAEKLHRDSYTVKGKTANKEEFVTCGGIALEEVNFKRMESRICPGLFFCGEILNIDGITGGFNFQNAWTTGVIAGTSSVD